MLLAFLALVWVPASAFWPFGGVQKSSYTIRGHLDRAPEGAVVLDRVELRSGDRPVRVLVISAYESPGDIPPFGGRLSQTVAHTYTLLGPGPQVERLLTAPEGSPVLGTFVVYEGSPAKLMITNLEIPAPADVSSRDP
jgi:hypothetical protein